jgi:hypothetical protein
MAVYLPASKSFCGVRFRAYPLFIFQKKLQLAPQAAIFLLDKISIKSGHYGLVARSPIISTVHNATGPLVWNLPHITIPQGLESAPYCHEF